MTIDEHVKRASRLSPLEIRLRDSLQAAAEVLSFAIDDGFLSRDQVLGLCVDPYGMLADIRAALTEANEIEQRRAKEE